jgi:hypothetical protein
VSQQQQLEQLQGLLERSLLKTFEQIGDAAVAELSFFATIEEEEATRNLAA